MNLALAAQLSPTGAPVGANARPRRRERNPRAAANLTARAARARLARPPPRERQIRPTTTTQGHQPTAADEPANLSRHQPRYEQGRRQRPRRVEGRAWGCSWSITHGTAITENAGTPAGRADSGEPTGRARAPTSVNPRSPEGGPVPGAFSCARSWPAGSFSHWWGVPATGERARRPGKPAGYLHPRAVRQADQVPRSSHGPAHLEWPTGCEIASYRQVLAWLTVFLSKPGIVAAMQGVQDGRALSWQKGPHTIRWPPRGAPLGYCLAHRAPDAVQRGGLPSPKAVSDRLSRCPGKRKNPGGFGVFHYRET
jgi:hypothetical protein